MSDLQKAIESKLINIINPKNEVKRPHNRLWIALVAFNLIFLPLDIATGVTVGLVSVWFYGLWVFGSGFGTMIVHEALFSNPYAKPHQKGIAIFGFFTSIAVTLLIGVGAIATSLLLSDYDRNLAGAIMSIVAFVVLFFHGLLIAGYYFSDAGFIAKSKATSALAESDRLKTEIGIAKTVNNEIKEIQKDLVESVNKGDGKGIGAAMSKITGEDWGELNPPN
jgi:hypothetical protein